MPPADPPPPLCPESLTWAVLLGRWVGFARSALALPEDAEGRRMRESVGDIIQLQAVWFALQHLDDLPPAERALGLDRAELLIDHHAAALRRRYTDAELPALVSELIADARAQLAATQA